MLDGSGTFSGAAIRAAILIVAAHPPRWKLFTPLVDGQMAFKALCLVNQVKPKSALSYAGAIPSVLQYDEGHYHI
jgi:hypothetical protein